jgi:membrane-associated protease RseP (regulator of RpoE activity)
MFLWTGLSTGLWTGLGMGLAADASGQQQPVVVPRHPSAGWIGFSYNVVVPIGSDSGPRIVVERIVDGSPAEEAGFRAGDVLLSINGRDATPAVFDRLRSRLAPGDSVTLEILRGDWRRTIPLVAAPQPSDRMVALPRDLFLRVTSTLERLDSIRVQISATGDGKVSTMIVSGSAPALILDPDVRVRRSVSGDSTSNRWPVATYSWTGELSVTPDEAKEGKPFRIFVLQQERPDSLRARISNLEIEVREVREEESRRLRALDRSMGAGAGSVQEDEILRTHAARRAELEGEVERLREALKEAFPDIATAFTRLRGFDQELRATVQSDRVDVPNAVIGGLSSAPRPLSAHIWGENRVAGARIVALNPELAAYFEVDGGLLVTDVTPGTPAADGGIQAGDVILRVGGGVVATVDDVRRALVSHRAGPVPVLLVRRGEEIQVRLPG